MSDRGSVTPLIATYLAIILLSVLSVTTVATAMLAGHRIQGVADYAVLYGHDRAQRAGKPSASVLNNQVRLFLETAVSAQKLEVVGVETFVSSDVSHIRLCGRYRSVFGLGISSMIICRQAAAKSFLLL